MPPVAPVLFAAHSPLTKSLHFNLSDAAIAHRLLQPLHRALSAPSEEDSQTTKPATDFKGASELCGAATALGMALASGRNAALREVKKGASSPTSPLLSALGSLGESKRLGWRGEK